MELHRWDLSIPEARCLQEELRSRVLECPLPGRPRIVAGTDIACARGNPLMFAAVVLCDARTLEVIEIARASGPASFPYVPGYLSFREVPLLLEAFARLQRRPDLVLCDGQGRAHPRRAGLACHLGLWLDVPTLGCAKSRLVGEHREPGPRRGCHSRLLHEGEVIGEVVRTRDGVRPVYVSVGHRITLLEARRMVLRLAPRHRLTEPIRAAHEEVGRMMRMGWPRRG